jgi:enamine deaminase RidA (YjgF/YER057c/UK114 family)
MHLHKCRAGLRERSNTMKEHRNPPNVHAPVAGYTHQIEVSEPARWLVLSGQIGKREDGTVPADPLEQLDVALDNVIRNLQAAHMDVPDLVKVTFYLVGDMDPQRRREIIDARLNGHLPCMTVLVVAALAHPDYKIEIDAWAASSYPGR